MHHSRYCNYYLIQFKFLSTGQWIICHLFPCPTFVLSSSCVYALARYRSLDSYSVAVVAKCTDVRIVTSSTQFPLISKILLKCILAKALSQHKFHPL